jgi:hypothetical protein
MSMVNQAVNLQFIVAIDLVRVTPMGSWYRVDKTERGVRLPNAILAFIDAGK